MHVKGSSDIRRATKGGSLPDRGLNGFSQRRRSSWIWGDNDPSSFLRRIVFDLFQREHATPSFVDGKEKLHNSNGNGALGAGDEILPISEPKVPSWKSVLDITCILLSLPVWLPL